MASISSSSASSHSFFSPPLGGASSLPDLPGKASRFSKRPDAEGLQSIVSVARTLLDLQTLAEEARILPEREIRGSSQEKKIDTSPAHFSRLRENAKEILDTNWRAFTGEELTEWIKKAQAFLKICWHIIDQEKLILMQKVDFIPDNNRRPFFGQSLTKIFFLDIHLIELLFRHHSRNTVKYMLSESDYRKLARDVEASPENVFWYLRGFCVERRLESLADPSPLVASFMRKKASLSSLKPLLIAPPESFAASCEQVNGFLATDWLSLDKEELTESVKKAQKLLYDCWGLIHQNDLLDTHVTESKLLVADKELSTHFEKVITKAFFLDLHLIYLLFKHYTHHPDIRYKLTEIDYLRLAKNVNAVPSSVFIYIEKLRNQKHLKSIFELSRLVDAFIKEKESLSLVKSIPRVKRSTALEHLLEGAGQVKEALAIPSSSSAASVCVTKTVTPSSERLLGCAEQVKEALAIDWLSLNKEELTESVEKVQKLFEACWSIVDQDGLIHIQAPKSELFLSDEARPVHFHRSKILQIFFLDLQLINLLITHYSSNNTVYSFQESDYFQLASDLLITPYNAFLYVKRCSKHQLKTLSNLPLLVNAFADQKKGSLPVLSPATKEARIDTDFLYFSRLCEQVKGMLAVNWELLKEEELAEALKKAKALLDVCWRVIHQAKMIKVGAAPTSLAFQSQGSFFNPNISIIKAFFIDLQFIPMLFTHYSKNTTAYNLAESDCLALAESFGVAPSCVFLHIANRPVDNAQELLELMDMFVQEKRYSTFMLSSMNDEESKEAFVDPLSFLLSDTDSPRASCAEVGALEKERASPDVKIELGLSSVQFSVLLAQVKAILAINWELLSEEELSVSIKKAQELLAACWYIVDRENLIYAQSSEVPPLTNPFLLSKAEFFLELRLFELLLTKYSINPPTPYGLTDADYVQLAEEVGIKPDKVFECISNKQGKDKKKRLSDHSHFSQLMGMFALEKLFAAIRSSRTAGSIQLPEDLLEKSSADTVGFPVLPERTLERQRELGVREKRASSIGYIPLLESLLEKSGIDAAGFPASHERALDRKRGPDVREKPASSAGSIQLPERLLGKRSAGAAGFLSPHERALDRKRGHDVREKQAFHE